MDDGEVLFQQTAKQRRLAVLLIDAVPLLTAIIVAALGVLEGGMGALPASAIVAAGLVGSGLLSRGLSAEATARVVVTRRELQVELGTASPRLPVAEIRSVRIAPSGLVSRGLGVKRFAQGKVIFSLLGDDARAVWVEREGPPMVIVCRDPDDLRDAITEACASAKQGSG